MVGQHLKNPWNEKIQKHCMAIARDADKLAAHYQEATITR